MGVMDMVMAMDMDTVMDITAMDIMVTMEREKQRLKLLLNQDTATMVMDMVMAMDMDIMVMDMVMAMDMDTVMDTTAMVIMVTMVREKLRLKLLLNQDTATMVMDMVMDTVMDITAMVIMVTMEREKLMLSQVTDTMDIMGMVMVMGMVMDMVIVMDTMVEYQIFFLCRKLSMNELEQLVRSHAKDCLKIEIK